MPHIFKALTDGTLSNPFRHVPKDSEILLTDAEAALYKKSRWLRPKAEADKIVEQPLMAHMKVHDPVAKMPPYSVPNGDKEEFAQGSKAYKANMEVLRAAEARLDKAEGTGNQDPLA